MIIVPKVKDCCIIPHQWAYEPKKKGKPSDSTAEARKGFIINAQLRFFCVSNMNIFALFVFHDIS